MERLILRKSASACRPILQILGRLMELTPPADVLLIVHLSPVAAQLGDDAPQIGHRVVKLPEDFEKGGVVQSEAVEVLDDPWAAYSFMMCQRMGIPPAPPWAWGGTGSRR